MEKLLEKLLQVLENVRAAGNLTPELNDALDNAVLLAEEALLQHQLNQKVKGETSLAEKAKLGLTIAELVKKVLEIFQ